MVLYLCCSLLLLSSLGVSADLFEALDKKDVKLYVAELYKTKDVNAPSLKGRLALIESVKLGKQFVDMSLEFGALPNQREPATDKAALHYALEKKVVNVARALLAWGADPDLPSKQGSPRDLAKDNKQLAKLLADFDARGAVAFEDPPGFWAAGRDKKHGQEFFHSTKLAKSIWRRCPSLSWTVAEVQGNRLWVNEVTHQTLWRLPDALAWRVKGSSGDGDRYWFNFRTNATSLEQPAELRPDVARQAVADSVHYWVNDVTEETAWEMPQVSEWTKLKDPGGTQHFYYNTATKESTWAAPPDLAWREVHSEEHGRGFWHNDSTGESSWTKPVHLAWRQAVPELSGKDL